MNVRERNNVNIIGSGSQTIVFSHGFGCDQSMWRFLVPSFSQRYQVILYDLVGSGGSDLSAYDPKKYDSLQGYADDLLEIIDEFAAGPVLFVGHSVSAMIGVLADIKRPSFAAHLMIGPSPCYINDGEYIGGFELADINSLLETLESNYLGWSSSMAPAIMGAPNQPELSEELTNSFCRTDPEIARQFARVTFLSDNRADVAKITAPVLILQCSDDLIAPVQVGEFLHREIPDSTLHIIENIGHCPHLSEPAASIDAMKAFIQTLTLAPGEHGSTAFD